MGEEGREQGEEEQGKKNNHQTNKQKTSVSNSSPDPNSTTVHSSKSPSVAPREVSHFGVSSCSLSTTSAPGATAASGKLLGWRHPPCHGRKAQSLLAPGCRALDCARRERGSRCLPLPAAACRCAALPPLGARRPPPGPWDAAPPAEAETKPGLNDGRRADGRAPLPAPLLAPPATTCSAAPPRPGGRRAVPGGGGAGG